MNINLTATEVSIVLDLLRDQILYAKQNYEVNPRNISPTFILQLELFDKKIRDVLNRDNK